MKGLWHMDRLQFELALQYLTHPSLVPTFHEEILETLVDHAKDDVTLPLAYYHTVQPVLSTSRALGRLFTAIARTSVTEAFYFARGQLEAAHRQMFEALISSVLHAPAGEAVAARSIELVKLPFTKDEELWFDEYLTNGEGHSLKRAKDTLLMRKVGANRFSQALALRDISTGSSSDLNWATLQNGIHEGLGRRAMMGGNE